jgi:hypothetical protein
LVPDDIQLLFLQILCRVIVLLGDEKFRTKALDIIKTVTVRVKNSPSVVLPIPQLLKVL